MSVRVDCDAFFIPVVELCTPVIMLEIADIVWMMAESVFCVLQRGSDELLSQSGGVSNGNMLSPQPNHADNNNDAKKVA